MLPGTRKAAMDEMDKCGEPTPVREGRQAMTEPVASFWKWDLGVHCVGGCRKYRSVSGFVPMMPPEATLCDLVRRLRCECGFPTSYVFMIFETPNDPCRYRYVVLISPPGLR